MKSILFSIFIFVFFSKINSQNKFPFSKNNKWYYVDTAMKNVSNITYDFIFPFQAGYAVAKQNNKYGVIDGNEKIIISFQYDSIEFNYRPPFYCTKNKQMFCLDINEKPLKMEATCSQSSSTSMFFTYKKNNKIGILKYNQPYISPDSLPNIYDEFYEYFCGVAIVRINKEWGTINLNNQIITPIALDSIQIILSLSDFDKHKLIKYYSKNKVGFINTSGVMVTKPKYLDSYFNLMQFTLVRTSKNKLVYIDSKGKEYYK